MTSAAKAYTFRTVFFMLGYVVALVLAVGGALDAIGGVSGWILLAFIRDSDEFVAGVTAKRFILAAGMTFALSVFWGFAEKFAEAPHVEGWWVYVVFWGLMGFMPVFIRSSR